MKHELRILYEDNHLLGVCKPGGLLVQGDATGDVTALDLAKKYVKEKYARPGNVFMGLVHRIDRPVSGVVVFARTSKAASRLARSFHDRDVEKVYLAIVIGALVPSEGELTGNVERVHRRSRLASTPSARAKESRLSYRALAREDGMTLVEVTPHTGRHHQIRLQLSAAGHPVAGDLKYGAGTPLPDKTIALHAVRLVFPHPIKKDEQITLQAPPPLDHEPWDAFATTIGNYFERDE
jgi:23S rRNA pseudouridine1911/1915/1917 synthase